MKTNKNMNLAFLITGIIALLTGAYFLFFRKKDSGVTTGQTASKAEAEKAEKEQTEQTEPGPETAPDGTYTNPLADPAYSPGTSGGSSTGGSTSGDGFTYPDGYDDSIQGNYIV